MTSKKILDLVFFRPCEPAFVSKGNTDIQKRFDLPDNFITDNYKEVVSQIVENENTESKTHPTKISVTYFKIPDIQFSKDIGRRDQFSIYIPLHREIACRLTELFVNCETFCDLESLAVYCRDYVNPVLFNYAISIALMHRTDSQDFLIPSASELFPDKFVRGSAFRGLREELQAVPDGSRVPVQIPPVDTASNVNHEDRVAYFREDLGLNLNYFTFNLVYPCDAIDIKIVSMDRRGELWYYHHQQLIARYNCERLCNKLHRVKRLNNLRVPIEEGYFPKLNTQNTNNTWPPRFDNAALSDLNRPNEHIHMDISQLERWTNRIVDAIEVGYALGRDGTHVPLNNNYGIDCLGNIIQSSMLSPNRKFYGDLNNLGHLFISYCHDPDNKYLESYGVMGEPATAMRDPVFYRWHSYLGDIFQLHKKNLEPYSNKQLDYLGITISGVELQFQNKTDGTVKNVLQTFLQESDFEVSRGLDFSPKGTAYIRLTHLQHHPFTYKIKVNCRASALKKGTVRIFLAPIYDERGRRLTFEYQRRLMIEMDRFITELREGQNLIIRRSDESSVTVAYDTTFNPESNRIKFNKQNENSERSVFCKCGLPQHLLVPRGSENGVPFVVFVMISNFTNDEVGNDQTDFKSCNDASSYCGIYHKKYPDARPMGFPFDRPASYTVLYLNDFLCDNMRAQDIFIKFLNKTVSSTNQATSANP